MIREMELRDVPQAAALEAQIFSMPWSESGFAEALSQNGNVFLVEERDNKIVGYGGIYCAADEGELTNVAIAQEFRGQGLGYALLSALLEAAHEKGAMRIYLEVRTSNHNAARLYEKAGFTICGRRKGFYQKPDEDAFVMMAESE